MERHMPSLFQHLSLPPSFKSIPNLSITAGQCCICFRARTFHPRDLHPQPTCQYFLPQSSFTRPITTNCSASPSILGYTRPPRVSHFSKRAMPSQGRILTPEQLALSQARKRKKAEAAALAAASASNGQIENFRSLLLPRKFLSEKAENISASEQTVIMSWNVRETLCKYSSLLMRSLSGFVMC